MQGKQTPESDTNFEIGSSNNDNGKVQFRTSFNDEEYQRWSDKLQSTRSLKGKADTSK